MLDAYQRAIRAHPKLSREAEAALGRRALAGDRAARDALVMSHIRCVVRFARRCPPHLREDAEQEGLAGLVRAADKFDPSRGFRFSTYAPWWIRAYIQRFVREQSTGIKAPMCNGIAIGPPPPCDSLDLPTAGDDGATFLDLRESPDPLPDHMLAAREQARAVNAAVARVAHRLTPLAQSLVRDRLAADEPLTLDEVGDEHGISRERVRQVEGDVVPFLRRWLAPVRDGTAPLAPVGPPRPRALGGTGGWTPERRAEAAARIRARIAAR